MSSSSAPRRLDRAWSRAASFTVPALAEVVLIAGIVGSVPGDIALAVGVGATALWVTWILWRAALAIHHDEGKFAACRGAGLLGLGTLLVGLTSTLPAIRPPGFELWCVLGVAAASTMYVLGASLMPGAASSLPMRLRRMFDGLGLGVSLGFAGYLITPVGRVWGVSLLIMVLTAAGISIITVIVLRAALHRRSILRCGFGVIAVLCGQCTVINLAVAHWHVVATPIVGLGMVLGLTLCAEGGSRLEPPPRPAVAEPEQYLSSYPLLAVPAAVGVIAAVYHLIVMGTWDRTAILLGVLMVVVLMLREVLVVRDIRQYAGQLKEKEAHFRSLVAGATDLTLVLDERLRILWQSPAAARVFGLADSQVVGRTYRELIHPDDVAVAQAVIQSVLAGEHADGPPALVNARFRDGNGMWRDTESTVSDQRSVPEVSALVVHVRDVGERRHLERTLHRLSYTDQLTGLANRRALMRDVLEYRRKAGQQGTVLVIDLHGLTKINDEHGRETGDAVLIEVGRRTKGLLGDEDVPARLGGDEFAVLTADGAVLAYALATRLLTLLLEPYQLPGATVDLHLSIGLAELAGGSDSEEVLRHADLARKRARQLGRDRVEWYDPDVEMKLNRWMDLEQQVIGAAGRGEFDLAFQPVVNLRDQRPVGVEALLRWRHPKLGTIPPNELLPIARAVGVAGRIDEWVLDEACRHLANWSDGDNDFWISVNVAPKELLTARFPEYVAATLKKYDLDPERLVVEIAENWIAEDLPAIVASLAGLRKLGVRAGLDDFGAGQASLSHLRRLPVDMLKLDRSLVNPGDDNATGPSVIDVVVSLGRRLGLEIVAKGLETEAEIERARAAGCLYGQGFAFGRPAPAERTEAYLATHRS